MPCMPAGGEYYASNHGPVQGVIEMSLYATFGGEPLPTAPTSPDLYIGSHARWPANTLSDMFM